MSEDIAIVGMACVFPQAASLEAYWANLVGGVDAVTEIPADRWQHHANHRLPADHEAHIRCRRGGFIPSGFLFDPMQYGVMPKIVENGDPDQFLMLHLIDRALRDARIAPSDPSRERTDVIIGRGGYPTLKLQEVAYRAEVIGTLLELIDRRYPELLRGGWREKLEQYLRQTISPNDPESISTGISNLAASVTANRLDLYGAAYTVDAACASSLIAVEHAVERLRRGKADVAVAAGLFLNHGPPFWHVFTQIGALSPTGVLRAFDRRADGLVIGEGGGAVVLKRLDDARRHGDQVYALIKGVGIASDGRNTSVLAPSPVGQVKALQRAYAETGIDPAAVGYLELHGTGTVIGDLAEIASVKTFFGASPEPATGRAMGSVKSMIGHLMPASGIASLIKVALALSNKVLPPSLHCEEPHPELADAPFYLITETRPWIQSPARGPRRAGVNAFGFGGINAHAILEEVPDASPRRGVRPDAPSETQELRPRPVRPGVARPSELVIFCASSNDELMQKLDRAAEFLDRDRSGVTLTDVACALAGVADLSQSWKLALVCKDLDDLRARMQQCQEAMQAGAMTSSEDVYFSAIADRRPGKVALIFPGMDHLALESQSPQRVLELGLNFPEVRAVFDFFQRRDDHPEDQTPTSVILAPPACLPEELKTRLRRRLVPLPGDGASEERPDQRNLAAVMAGLACWSGWRLLAGLEIPVDMVVGQSFGDLGALGAAGSGDFEETAPIFWRLLSVRNLIAADGRLAFAMASEEIVAPLLAQHNDVHLAIHLAPQAVVFGGQSGAVSQIVARLQKDGVLARVLPYPPTHTPAFSHLREEFRKRMGLEDFQVIRLRVPVYSSVLADRYPEDPQGVMETLALNLDHPLKIWQTLRKMYDDGARVFVQVAGGEIVSRLEAMLPEGAEVVKAALDFRTREPLTQVHHLCATLLAAGVPVQLRKLYEGCDIRRVDLDLPQPASSPPRMAVPLRMEWTPLGHPCVPPPRGDCPDFRGEGHENGTVPFGRKGTGTICAEHPSGRFAANGASPPTACERLPDIPPSPAVAAEAGLDPILARLPVLGEIEQFVPNEKVVLHRMLDLDEDLYLKDHLFVHAPGVKPVEECIPVLPMTFSMEFMAEAAALLAPGMGLVGFEKIRASRWISPEGLRSVPLCVEAEVRPEPSVPGVRAVQATIRCHGKPSASAVVLFGSSYREDVRFEMADHRADGPWPLPWEDVYGRRRMFHGPTLQTISALGTLGNPVCTAELTVLPSDRLFASRRDPLLVTDPCALDGAGQLFGLWCQMYDLYVLPSQVEKVEFYCPPPPVGSRLPIRLEVTQLDMDARQVRCNFEIEDGQGKVWTRILGWADWIFKCPAAVLHCLRAPTEYCVADEAALPGLPPGSVGTLCTTASLRGLTALESLAGTFLQGHEVEEFMAIADPQQRRRVLCSRIALKDAARIWWTRTYGGELPHPAAFILKHDDQGRPWLEPRAEGRPPCVSLAHTDEAAVALVSPEPVGVDVEPVGRPVRRLLPEFATPAEIAILENLMAAQPDEAWETRLWCAKEAAAKLQGSGLQGRPKDFEATEIDPSGRLLVRHTPAGECFPVQTCLVDRCVVAYAFGQVQAGINPCMAV